MQSALLLDVVIRQGSTILQLLTGEDQALLVWWDAFSILDLCLHVIDGARSLNIEGDGIPRQCPHEDLHSPFKRSTRCEVPTFWML